MIGKTEAKANAEVRQRVEQSIRDRLGNRPYAYYFNQVKWRFDHGRLVLDGRVPSFYMKQLLQTVLGDVEHVEQIVNEVDVINSNGLSSVRTD